MRILFAGNKSRGIACLDAVRAAGHDIVAVLAHAGSQRNEFVDGARARGYDILQPGDLGDAALHEALRARRPEVTVLAGYGPIIKQPLIALAPLGCVNLHGGRLPQYRGSSPMNWALINGETEFTISITSVDGGVDTGPVLSERTFPIGPDDTIADLQAIADRTFPEMLVEVLRQVAAGELRPRVQDQCAAGYYPLRFPDDGLILWDTCTAGQAHNRIRALTDPYPGAFTFWNGQRVTLLRSRAAKRAHFGEPGRVYLKSHLGLLVCALDRCLWIERARFDDGADAVEAIPRYDQLATVRGAAADLLSRSR